MSSLFGASFCSALGRAKECSGGTTGCPARARLESLEVSDL